MRIETVLRHLVVWQWVLACLSIVFFQVEIENLPFLLKEYAAAEAARPATSQHGHTGKMAFPPRRGLEKCV